MKPLFFVIAASLLCLTWPQSTTTVLGQKAVQIQDVTFSKGAYTGKTRFRIYTPDSTTPGVYLDTSATGQTGQWVVISGTADSCSLAFNLGTDTTGGTRAIWENRLWHLIKAAGDSSTFTYRIQTRERIFNTRTRTFFWTPWTKAGINVGYADISILDTVIITDPGSTTKVSQYKLFQVIGAQGRLCPGPVAATGTSVGDSIIVDSVRVILR
jgi:hypothetical protein